MPSPTPLSGLSATEAQQVFRVVLDALSRPGLVVGLPSDTGPADTPPVVLAPLSIADVDVAVAILPDLDATNDGSAEAAATLIRRSTGARLTDDPTEADLVIALAPIEPSTLRACRSGTAVAPEAGAKVFLACERLEAWAPGHPEPVEPVTRVWLSGPGAAGGRGVDVIGVPEETVVELAHLNAGGPRGIDTWLVDRSRRVCGIPRSSTIDVIVRAD